METKDITQNIIQFGYSTITGYFNITDAMVEEALGIMDDFSYKGGKLKRTVPSKISSELSNIVFNSDLKNTFDPICKNIQCQEVFLTHDYIADKMERNMWLHFDRLRSLKVMVYLSDVSEDSGAFSVVPESHKVGHFLRTGFKNVEGYENKKNRIKLDYPHLYEEPIKICGPKGTVIFFDSDIFHLGGKIKENNERILIRSHWYPNMNWRINS